MSRASSSIRLESTALVVLTLSVVAVSAWLRLHGAGLGCDEWPACYGQNLSLADYRPPAVARAIHRVVASLALLLAILLAWRARSEPRPSWRRPVFGLLGLVVVLAAVGVWSHDPRNALVNFVNLVGGLGIGLALAWLGRHPDEGLRLLLVTGVLGGTIQVHSQPGHGTTFILTLPTTAPDRPSRESPA